MRCPECPSKLYPSRDSGILFVDVQRKEAMSTGKKIADWSAVFVLLAWQLCGFTVYQSHKSVVTVQTGKVSRRTWPRWSAHRAKSSPRCMSTSAPTLLARSPSFMCKEGDHVKKGQLLAQLENVQSTADVDATRASLEAAQTDSVAAEAALNTAQADLNRAQSDVERAQLDWSRAQGLYQRRADCQVGLRQPKSRLASCATPDSRKPRQRWPKPKRKKNPPTATSRRTAPI